MTDISANQAIGKRALLEFHLEPGAPIEVSELTAALGSISRQYQAFAAENGITDRDGGARLLVSTVAPGSIDISFLPDLQTTIAAAATLFSHAWDQYELVKKFAERLKATLDIFRGETSERSGASITVRDCDDATNIVNPIAHHGGHQSITVINGPVIHPVLHMEATEARKIVERAADYKASILSVVGERRQRIAMVWQRLDRDAAKTEGKRSPDQAIIADIDPRPHPVFFTDEMSHIKHEMIDDEENPYQKIFFVDVEISRIPGGKVGNYRIIGYHGKEDFEPPSSPESPMLG